MPDLIQRRLPRAGVRRAGSHPGISHTSHSTDGFAELCKKYDERFYRCSFFEWGPEYYRLTNLEEVESLDEDEYNDLEARIDECNWVVLPEGWTAPENPENCAIGDELVGRTDCDMIAIDECSVLYTAHPKHAESSEDVECQPLHLSTITWLLGQLEIRASLPVGKEARAIQL